MASKNDSQLFRDIEASKKADRQVGRCRRIWSAYFRRGVEVRYDMGVVLNEQHGAPDERQAYGKRVLKLVAKELRISRSELTRMKQFAAQFESFAAFREQEPVCRTWSAVKEMLSESVPDPVETGTSTTKKSVVSALVTSLNRLKRKLTATEFRGDEAELEQFWATLNELTKLAQSRLGQGLHSLQN